MALLLALLLGAVLGVVTTRGEKSQWIRVGDVVFLGPLMVVSGALLASCGEGGTGHALLGWLLVLLGAGTVAYNLVNYMAAAARPA